MHVHSIPVMYSNADCRKESSFEDYIQLSVVIIRAAMYYIFVQFVGLIYITRICLVHDVLYLDWE